MSDQTEQPGRTAQQDEAARTCANCQTVYALEAVARACERARCYKLIGFLRGEACPYCPSTYPVHTEECRSKPQYCESCERHTTHCDDGHCQECHIDEHDFPTEDCDACALLVGGILRISAEGSEVHPGHPNPDEIHDLYPNPHED